jgi:tetratricopeptide (TPR) repeat protein
MIRPLRSARVVWALDWVEIGEPVPAGTDYILPTCLFVVGEGGRPVLGQETLRELDQRRAENLLSRLFNERGTPDVVVMHDAPEWNRQAWRSFGKDFTCEIRVVADREADIPEALEMTRRVRDEIAARLVEACRGSAPGQRPSVIAAGLVRAALDLHSRTKRVAVLEKALELDPRCAGALLELGELALGDRNFKQALARFTACVAVEEPRWHGFEVRWWEDPDTRIYLRALHGLMMTQWHREKHEEALETAEKLLATNPRDNQGVRFLVPLLMQLCEQPERALEFFKNYEAAYRGDYAEPSLLFAWGLTLSQHEDEAGAVLRYREGMLRNPYIAPQLLDLPEPRTDIWHPSDRSEPAYADDFVDSYAGLWDRDAGALRILREAHETAAPSVGALIDLRARMAELQDQRYDPGHDAKWRALVEEEKALLGEAGNGRAGA